MGNLGVGGFTDMRGTNSKEQITYDFGLDSVTNRITMIILFVYLPGVTSLPQKFYQDR